jgi:hypothetical protein
MRGPGITGMPGPLPIPRKTERQHCISGAGTLVNVALILLIPVPLSA